VKKLLVLLKKREEVPQDEFDNLVREELIPLALRVLPSLRGAASYLAGEQVPMVRGGRAFDATADAILSLYLPPSAAELTKLEDLVALLDHPEQVNQWEELLKQAAARSGVYVAEEVRHWGCERTWQDGEPTPGFKMMAFSRRRSGMLRQDYIEHYRDIHAPLAREHHPALWSYTQNFVSAKLYADAPGFDCMAEMHFKSVEDLHENFYLSGQSAGVIGKDLAKFMEQRSVRLASVQEVIHQTPTPSGNG